MLIYNAAQSYFLKKKLHTGGMAEIFLAEKKGALGFSKSVIIKQIAPEWLHKPEIGALFIKEALLHSQLDHPNIISIQDLGENNHYPYMVLEYIERVSFTDLIRSLSLVSPNQRLKPAFQIISDLLFALDYIHRLGIVHQDISPSNLLISRAGITKLCDFGLAETTNTQESAHQHARGKIRYMPPERLSQLFPDPRSDLFSVGICLFELITLQPFFEQKSDSQVIKALRLGGYLKRLNMIRHLEPHFQVLLERALQPSPENRFASAKEFLSALYAH